MDGSEHIFRRLVDAYSPRLLAVIRPFAADTDDAHDLLQETWRRAYVKRRTFSGTGSLLGWLYAVCRSVCLSDVRVRSARAAGGAMSPA